MQKAVIIELVPRASRIHVLLSWLQSGLVSTVVCPVPVGAGANDVVAQLSGLAEVVTFSASKFQWWNLLRATWLAARIARRNRDAVVWSALDDYFLAFGALGILLRLFVFRLPTAVIKYRVQFMMQVDTRRELLLKFWWQLVLAFVSPTVVGVFDERLFPTPQRKLRLLADPAEAYFEFSEPLELQDEFALLLVGVQNSRKGIDQISRSMQCISELAEASGLLVKIVCAGKVDEKTELDRLLCPRPGIAFEYLPGWKTEAELAGLFRNSHLILLPYHPSHTATSGVLARAATVGRAVLASDVGLVSWRVNQYQLGRVFAYGSTESLVDAMRTIIGDLRAGRVFYSPSFAESSSLTHAAERFEVLMRSIFSV